MSMNNTEKNYRLAIERFKKSKESIEIYFSKLSGSNQKMFLAAAKKYNLDTSIISKMKRNESDIKSFKAYTLEELLNLQNKIKDLDIKNQAIIMTMLETGCRRNEIISIWSEYQESKSRIVFIYGKGNKKGKIFITDELANILDKWILSPDFKLYSNEQINNLTRDSLKYCGLSGSCHDLRRAFATNLRRHFVPIEQIQILLRHNDIQTTIGYIRITDEEIWNSLKNKYLNVDEYINENNFREKYLELLQKNMRQAERIKELENELYRKK